MALAVQVFSYVVFILSIVQICNQKDLFGQGIHNYVPAIVAILVMSCLQMLYHLGYWVYSKRPLYSIRNMLVALVFFLCFNFGAVVALTVQRHDFCGGTPEPGRDVDTTRSDCQGLIRAMMGMTWNLFGWTLIYIFYLLGLNAFTHSGSSTPVGKAGEVTRKAAGEDKV